MSSRGRCVSVCVCVICVCVCVCVCVCLCVCACACSSWAGVLQPVALEYCWVLGNKEYGYKVLYVITSHILWNEYYEYGWHGMMSNAIYHTESRALCSSNICRKAQRSYYRLICKFNSVERKQFNKLLPQRKKTINKFLLFYNCKT